MKSEKHSVGKRAGENVAVPLEVVPVAVLGVILLYNSVLCEQARALCGQVRLVGAQRKLDDGVPQSQRNSCFE